MDIWDEKVWKQKVEDFAKKKKTTKVSGSIGGGGITIDFPKVDTWTVAQGTKADVKSAGNKSPETPLAAFRRRIRRKQD
jgi:hypothetical protein